MWIVSQNWISSSANVPVIYIGWASNNGVGKWSKKLYHTIIFNKKKEKKEKKGIVQCHFIIEYWSALNLVKVSLVRVSNCGAKEILYNIHLLFLFEKIY